MLFRKAVWLVLISNLVFTGSAHSADGNRIGFVAPFSGAFAPIGTQMQAGADAAAERLSMELVKQDEQCTPEGGAASARALIAQNVKLVVGFTCLDSLSAALPLLRDAGIVTISTGVRADALTDQKAKSEFLLYRLSPREDMEVAALAEALLPRWRDQNFAIIDDGTVQARNTAEALRFALTEAGLQPVFTDTFRPGLENQAALVRRLQKAGASHVFVGGDVEDALVISKAAQGEMEFAIGEAPNPDSGIEGAGTVLSVSLPDYSATPHAAKASVALQNKRIEPENYALTAYASVEIAHALDADATQWQKLLNNTSFATAIGAVSFDIKGDLKTNPFVFVVLDGGRFKPVGPSLQ